MKIRTSTHWASLLALSLTACNAILDNAPVELDMGDSGVSFDASSIDGSRNDTSTGADNRLPDGAVPDTSRDGGGGGAAGAGGATGGGGKDGGTGGTGGASGGSGGASGSGGSGGSGGATGGTGGTTGGTGGASGGGTGGTGTGGSGGSTADAAIDRSTPPDGGGPDVVTPPPDTGPTCPSPQIECAGKCVSPTDPKTCGSCTHDCTNLPNVSGAVTCQAGACVVPPGSCAPGWAHCSTNPDDGCEVDISKPEHCGSCTTVCTTATPLCAQNGDGGTSSFQCKSQCAAPSPDVCGQSCVNKTSDPLNCGACGTKCNPPTTHGTATCSNSTCGFQCNPNYSVCGNDCVDLNNDVLNCKTCGTKCAAPAANGNPICTAGTCGFACSASYPNACSGTCVNFKTDVANCGSCGGACQPPANGTVTGCSNGQCQTACNTGFEKVGNACIQTKFYISETGDDTALGTQAAPVKTWKRAATRASVVTNPQIIFLGPATYSSTTAGEDLTTSIPEGATVTTSGGRVLIEGNAVYGMPFAGSGTVNGGAAVDTLTLRGFSGALSTTGGTQTVSHVTLSDIRSPMAVYGNMTIDSFAMESIDQVASFRVYAGTLTLTNGSVKALVGVCFNSSPGQTSVNNTGSLTASNVTFDGNLMVSTTGKATFTGSTFLSFCGTLPSLEVRSAAVAMTNCTASNAQILFNGGSAKVRGTTFDLLTTFQDPGTYDFGMSASDKGNNNFISGILVQGLNVTVNASGNHWIANEPPAKADGTVDAGTMVGDTYSSQNVTVNGTGSTVRF